jgi:hypothetical protein
MSKLTQKIIDKLSSKYRNWKYKENVYFKIADINVTHDGLLAIELLKGPYKGIIYCYGSIKIGEDLGYKGSMASYDINIINDNMNHDIKDAYMNDSKFGKITGYILLNVMETAITMQAEKYIKDNFIDEENRENYSEEFTPQRTVREEDSSVPKKRVSSGKKRKSPVRRNSKVRSKVQSDTDA